MAMSSTSNSDLPSFSSALQLIECPEACNDRRCDELLDSKHLANLKTSADPKFFSGKITSSVSFGSFSSTRRRSASQDLADPFLPHTDILRWNFDLGRDGNVRQKGLSIKHHD